MGAYASACHHGRQRSDQEVVEASRENLQYFLRRSLGHSPSACLGSLWDAPRAAFVAGELRLAAGALRQLGLCRGRQARGGVAACVIEGAGWEAAWLARHAGTLGVSEVVSVRGARTAGLGHFEARLAESNGVQVTVSSWEELPGYLSLAAPAGLLVLLGGCLAAHPAPPSAVVADVTRLAVALSQADQQEPSEERRLTAPPPARFVPKAAHWVGGVAWGPTLQGKGVIDAGDLRENFGLDYDLARQKLRPKHSFAVLAEGGADWVEERLASVSMEDVWNSQGSAPERLSACLRSVPGSFATRPGANAPSPDAVVWWTAAEGAGAAGETGTDRADAGAQGREPPVWACSPRLQQRTWQVAVFDEAWDKPVSDVLQALSSPSEFRSYHIGMLNDSARTAYYDSAIAAVVADWPAEQPILALDIGAGTGLLSMLLAKHARARFGARLDLQVLAVEAEANLAELAVALVRANGFDDVIEVRQTLSTKLGPGLFTREDKVGVRANLCLHEIFGSDPLAERVLPALAHAQAELLTPDAVLVPAGFRLHAALCAGRALHRSLLPPAAVEGLSHVGEVFRDLAPVTEAMFMPACTDNFEGYRQLTPAASTYCDLRSLPSAPPEERILRLSGEASEDLGSLKGDIFAVFWFSLDGPNKLDTSVDTSPTRPWAPVFQRVAAAATEHLSAIRSGGPFVADVAVRLATDRTRCRLAWAAMDEEEETAELGSFFEGIE